MGEVLLHNLQQFFLASRIEEKEARALQAELGRALLHMWRTGQFEGGRALGPPEVEALRDYCARHLIGHLRKGLCWSELGEFLADVEFLRIKQDPASQLGFEAEIRGLLADETVPMGSVLQNIAPAIMAGMELSREKADWLDTLAYWLGQEAPTRDQRRWEGLKRIAVELDEACGEVSRELAEKYLEDGNPDWAMRFGELRAWVCQRRGDLPALVAACDAGVAMCQTKEIPEGYRTLGLAEFMRMRACAYESLAREANEGAQARVAEEFEELSRVFSEIGSGGWKLTQEEWLALQGPGPKGFALSHRQTRDDSRPFAANVVSNEHDAIGAMYLIQALESLGGLVDWIHHLDFEPGQLDEKGLRLTVLIGGPKAPGSSKVARRFYESDREAYLRMYSGLHFGPIATKLVNEENGSVAYMLGGVSKLHTLQAVYDFVSRGTAEAALA